MKLSVIVAACERDLPKKGGRLRVDMLAKCLQSIRNGGHADFECLVCSDGHSDLVRETVKAMDDERFKYACVPHRGVYGAGTQRNAMTAIASGSHLCWIDDDDRYAPNGLGTIAEGIAAHPDCPLIFQMEYPRSGRVIWRDDGRCKGQPKAPAIRGFVGTPMFVIPNKPAKLGRWGLANYSDADFVESTLAKGWPDPVWIPKVVAHVRLQHDREEW